MVLELKNIQFTYPQYSEKGETAFSLPEVNLLINPGQITMIMGRPGSGKTTLAKILQGTIPHMNLGAFKGKIFFNKSDFGELKPGKRMESLFVSQQNPEEQIICNRCDEEIAFCLESLGMGRREISERIEKALVICGLEGFESRMPASLSGGEKKKLMIASLLALDPQIYIIDETLEEISLSYRLSVLQYLKTNKKTTVLFCSRLQKEYLDFCSGFSLISGKGIITGNSIEDLKTGLAENGLDLSGIKRKPLQNKNRELLLEANSIKFEYPGNDSFKLQVDSLNIYKNEIIAFTGDNGSGKSTLAKILCGLLKPADGFISVNGKAVNAAKLSRQICYIFQNPDHQLFLPTIKDELSAVSKSRDEMQNCLKLFGLPSVETPVSLLSFGTRKKLQAAVFFLTKHDPVILDEVDSGLSPQEILDIIDNFHRQGRSIILITHDHELAEIASHRQIRFDAGMTGDGK